MSVAHSYDAKPRLSVPLSCDIKFPSDPFRKGSPAEFYDLVVTYYPWRKQENEVIASSLVFRGSSEKRLFLRGRLPSVRIGSRRRPGCLQQGLTA